MTKDKTENKPNGVLARTSGRKCWGAALRRGLHTHTRVPRAGVQSHTVQGRLGLEASPQNVPPGPPPGLMLSGPLLDPLPLHESRQKLEQTGVFKFPVSRTPSPGHMVPSAARGPAGWGRDRVGTHTERPTTGTLLCPAGSIQSAHAGLCTGCRSRRAPRVPLMLTCGLPALGFGTEAIRSECSQVTSDLC